MKISIYSAIVGSMALFAFTTLTQTLWPFAINQMLGFCIFAELLYLGLKTLKKNECVIVFIVIFCFFISFLLTGNFRQNLTDSTCWVVTCILFIKLADQRTVAKLKYAVFQQRRLIKWMVILSSIVILIGFFLPQCYYGADGWGKREYYLGFSVFPHVFCSGACLVLVLTLFLLEGRQNKWWHFMALLPGSLGIMESGARTYIVSIALVFGVYFLFYVKNSIIKWLGFPIICTVGIISFLNSSMKEKFVFLQENIYIPGGSVLGRLSSGRNVFWAIDWQAFQEYSLLNKLLGNGFDYVYEINELEYGARILAHNDLINLMLSVGIIGTGAYCVIFLKLFTKRTQPATARITKAIIVIFLFFPALVNGLFIYQHYVYSGVFLYLLLAPGKSLIPQRHSKYPNPNVFSLKKVLSTKIMDHS